MAEFVNLCPLGQDRKKEALITKRSMAFWNGQLTSVMKKEITPVVFGQTFIFVSPISWHLRWQKTVFFAFEFEFFWGGGGGILLKIYRNISCVKSCLSFNCCAYLDLHRQTTQTIEEANSSQNSFSHQKLGDVQLIRRAENFEVRK